MGKTIQNWWHYSSLKRHSRIYCPNCWPGEPQTTICRRPELVGPSDCRRLIWSNCLQMGRQRRIEYVAKARNEEYSYTMYKKGVKEVARIMTMKTTMTSMNKMKRMISL